MASRNPRKATALWASAIVSDALPAVRADNDHRVIYDGTAERAREGIECPASSHLGYGNVPHCGNLTACVPPSPIAMNG
jgi:hypothetical protein